MRIAALAFCLVMAFVPVARAQSVPEQTFEAFWSLYDRHYALFQVKGVDWDAVHAVYRPRVTAATSRDELFAVFSSVIGHLNDVHISVRDEPGNRVARSGGLSPDSGEFSLDVIARAYASGNLAERAGGLVRFARLSGGIGYIHLTAFRHPTATADAIDEAMASFGDTRVIILDVRNNGGGSDRVAQIVANRLGRGRSLYMTAAPRLPGGGFGQAVEWWRESGAFTGRVIVLTNRRTISAAENLVLAMRTVPGAMIVGDTTAGAMADTVPMAIGDGWTFTVPVNVMRDRDGVSWEGVGLAPALWVRNTPEAVRAGRDAVLELAIALARHAG